MPRIKQLRKQKHLGAMELAELAKLDLNQPLMSAAESGKLLFTPNALERVCKALDCTPLDLFDNPDEFDLMSVQRRMGGVAVSDMVEAHSDKSKCDGRRAIPNRPMYFDQLPEGNPKRSAGRWSDTDWDNMVYALKSRGYKDVKQYLAMNLLGVSNLRDRA